MGLKERFRQRKEKIKERMQNIWQRTRRYVRFGVYIDRSTPASTSHGHNVHTAHDPNQHAGEQPASGGEGERGVENITENEQWIREYVALKKATGGVSPRRIVYPGSGRDISLSKVFPESEVYYIDNDPGVISSLQKAQQEGKLPPTATIKHASIKQFQPSAVDLVVLHNAATHEMDAPKTSRVLSASLSPGGFVFVGAWGGSPGFAKEFLQIPELKLIGRFVHEGQDVGIDNTNLDQLRQRIAHAGSSPEPEMAGSTLIFQKGVQEARQRIQVAA